MHSLFSSAHKDTSVNSKCGDLLDAVLSEEATAAAPVGTCFLGLHIIAVANYDWRWRCNFYDRGRAVRVAAAVRRGPGQYSPAAGARFNACSLLHTARSVVVAADSYSRWTRTKPFLNLVQSRLHHVLRAGVCELKCMQATKTLIGRKFLQVELSELK